MSHKTKIEFEELVNSYQKRHRELCLSDPIFEEAGFMITAKMVGSDGQVILRCGPAEYHVEIFIHTARDGKRWTLANLLEIPDVQNWMLLQKPKESIKTTMEIEVDLAFSLLSKGLCGDKRFDWLYS